MIETDEGKKRDNHGIMFEEKTRRRKE